MSYCTLDQLKDRYGEALLVELSFRGSTQPTEPDAALFARAIADADALIDGYLKVRYSLPISGATPALLTDVGLKVAIYNAHANVVSEKIRADYQDALKLLDKIAQGTVKLDAAGVEPASAGSSGARLTDRDRPFTATNLKGYF